MAESKSGGSSIFKELFHSNVRLMRYLGASTVDHCPVRVDTGTGDAAILVVSYGLVRLFQDGLEREGVHDRC
jgi:hypothetical protein